MMVWAAVHVGSSQSVGRAIVILRTRFEAGHFLMPPSGGKEEEGQGHDNVNGQELSALQPVGFPVQGYQGSDADCGR